MSTHNLGFYEDLTKIIFESSNMHLISSAEYRLFVLIRNSYNPMRTHLYNTDLLRYLQL